MFVSGYLITYHCQNKIKKLLIKKTTIVIDKFWVIAAATAAAVTVNQFETTLLHNTIKISVKCLLITKNTMQIDKFQFTAAAAVLLHLQLLQLLKICFRLPSYL